MANVKKLDTQKIGLRLDTEAIELLSALAPSENRKGWYVGQLIRAAWAATHQAEGRDSAPAPAAAPALDDPAALRRELARLAGELGRIGQVAAEMATVTQRLLALEDSSSANGE